MMVSDLGTHSQLQNTLPEDTTKVSKHATPSQLWNALSEDTTKGDDG